ncbi:MAG: hypothetical protein AAGA48_31205 [Myxococcota bacterium]
MLYLFMALAPAFGADVVQGANTAAMGGIGAAAANDNASITLNPGLLGLVERYDFHAHLRLGPNLNCPAREDCEGGSDRQWAATALDARTSKRFAAGFAYSGDRFSPPLRQNELPGWKLPDEELGNRRRQDDFTLSLGVPFWERRMSLGLGLLYSRFNHDRDGSGSTADLHAGWGFRPVNALTLGVGVRNFVPTNSVQDRPLSVVAGLRITAADIVAVEANLTSTSEPLADSRWSFAAGAEAALGSSFRLRLGAVRDGPLAVTQLTTGLGIATKRGGGLDYALSIPLAGRDLRGNTLIHQFAIRFSAPEDILEED